MKDSFNLNTNLQKVYEINNMKNKVIILIFILTILITQESQSGWFGPDHYFGILVGSTWIYSKGEPTKSGEFTIFNRYPQNHEMRVKTNLIKAIEDLGVDPPKNN